MHEVVAAGAAEPVRRSGADVWRSLLGGHGMNLAGMFVASGGGKPCVMRRERGVISRTHAGKLTRLCQESNPHARRSAHESRALPEAARRPRRLRHRQCLGCGHRATDGRASASRRWRPRAGRRRNRAGSTDGVTRRGDGATPGNRRGNRSAGLGRSRERLRRYAGGCSDDHPRGRRDRPGRRLDRGLLGQGDLSAGPGGEAHRGGGRGGAEPAACRSC